MHFGRGSCAGEIISMTKHFFFFLGGKVDKGGLAPYKRKPVLKETFMTHGDTHEHENNKAFSYQKITVSLVKLSFLKKGLLVVLRFGICLVVLVCIRVLDFLRSQSNIRHVIQRG